MVDDRSPSTVRAKRGTHAGIPAARWHLSRTHSCHEWISCATAFSTWRPRNLSTAPWRPSRLARTTQRLQRPVARRRAPDAGVPAPLRLGDRRAAAGRRLSPRPTTTSAWPWSRPTRASPTGASCTSGSSRRRGTRATPGTTAGWCLRLYDVSYIEFNGLNAHRIQDQPLPALCGQHVLQAAPARHLAAGRGRLPAAQRRVHPGGPLAGRAVRRRRPPRRAAATPPCWWTSRGAVEEIGNLWDQERILRERRQPQLRKPLRIAAFALASLASGQDGTPATLRLRAGRRPGAAGARGPRLRSRLATSCPPTARSAGVHYHPLEVSRTARPWSRRGPSPGPPRSVCANCRPSTCSTCTNG